MEDMHPYLALAITIAYWLLYPLYVIAYWTTIAGRWILLAITDILLSVLSAFSQPFVFVGGFIAYLAYLPLSVAQRFETIGIYLGVGGIVGIVAGLVVYIIFSVLVWLIGLKQTTSTGDIIAKDYPQTRQQKGQTQYRAPEVEEAGPETGSEGATKPSIKPDKLDRSRLSALPKLTLQGPSPEGRRSLLDQTMEDDADSDI